MNTGITDTIHVRDKSFQYLNPGGKNSSIVLEHTVIEAID